MSSADWLDAKIRSTESPVSKRRFGTWKPAAVDRTERMRCIPWVGAVGSGLLLDRKRVICGRQRAEIAKEGRVIDENGMVDLEADSLIGL